MRVCFVNPRIPPAAMNFHFAMDLVGAKFSHIPLGLATLAALTPENIEVTLADENVAPIDPRIDADVVALTGIFCQKERLFELADAFRSKADRIVVIGGPIVDDAFEECRAHADVLFRGEAEETWPRFCADLVRGSWSALYEQAGFVDMISSPIPRFELFRSDDYASGCVQATRGCPYRCEYCDVPAKHGNRPRSKPIAQVLEEVRRLVALGFDSIFFVDDNFMGNRRYAEELLRALAALVASLPTPVYFYTQVTLNLAKDEEMLALFRAASFRRFFIGVETPNHDQLRAMEKHHNLELDPKLAIERIQAHNITVWAGIIVGLDGDSAESFEAQLRFISECAFMPTLIGVLQAMPAAPLHRRVAQEGRLRLLPEQVGSGAFGSIGAMGTSNVMPKTIEMPHLLRGFAELVRRVYEPAAYGDRLIRAMAKGGDPHPSLRGVITRKNLAIVKRTFDYYRAHPDADVRRLFRRVMTAALARRGRGLEELLYHLVIYKHLRTFYLEAAEVAERAAA